MRIFAPSKYFCFSIAKQRNQKYKIKNHLRQASARRKRNKFFDILEDKVVQGKNVLVNSSSGLSSITISLYGRIAYALQQTIFITKKSLILAQDER